MYDYLIVGSGLFGSVFAHEAVKKRKKCLVIDRREHLGGNVYCERIEGITVHRYGAHIFHTDDNEIWNYVNQFAVFNRFTNTPIANYRGQIYNLPFNMNTFHALWGVKTPAQAMAVIERQRVKNCEPKNLEEQALAIAGTDIYEKLIKGYTEKQWGRPCRELPALIIKRIPLRFTYDNSYFNDRYQGIPEGGYNTIIEKLLDGSELRLGVDFLKEGDSYRDAAKTIVFTGAIDEYFGSKFGVLEYRSLRFETEVLDTPNYQGCAVINYTCGDIPYTRIVEHKHFEYGQQEKTVITREYPAKPQPGKEPFYPVNDEKNNALYRKYRWIAQNEKNVIFGGRLGLYQYLDMWQVIAEALKTAKEIL